MSTAFDTLRMARTLRDKAYSRSEQADATQGDMATQRDLAELRSGVREAEARLQARFDTSKADVRTEFAILRSEIPATQHDTVRWIVGTIGFQTVAILAVAVALARILTK